MADQSESESDAKRAMIDSLMSRAKPQQVGSLAEAAMTVDDNQLKLGVMFEAANRSVARFSIENDMNPYAASKVLAASGHIEKDHPFLYSGKGEDGRDTTPVILSEIGRKGLELWGGYYENFHDLDVHAAHLRNFGVGDIMKEARSPNADLALVAEKAEATAIRIGKDVKSGAAESVGGIYDWVRGMAEVSVEIARRESPAVNEKVASRQGEDR